MTCNRNCNQGRDCDCGYTAHDVILMRGILVALAVFWVGVGALVLW